MTQKKGQVTGKAAGVGLATVQEVAEYLRVSVNTVYRLVAEKKVSSKRILTAVRIEWDSVKSL